MYSNHRCLVSSPSPPCSRRRPPSSAWFSWTASPSRPLQGVPQRRQHAAAGEACPHEVCHHQRRGHQHGAEKDDGTGEGEDEVTERGESASREMEVEGGRFCCETCGSEDETWWRERARWTPPWATAWRGSRTRTSLVRSTKLSFVVY